jgi:hypothetical protein
MKTVPGRRFLSTLSIVVLLSFPASSDAATAALPWDYPLAASQTMLVATIAPWSVGLAITGSVLLYVIGGHNEQAERLFGCGIGGLIALALVYFLNYVAF